MSIDELNQLKEYFEPMGISDEEKKKRASVGELFYDAFFYVLTLLKADARLNDELDSEFYTNTLAGRLMDSLDENDVEYDPEYVHKMASDIIESTIDHYSEEEYFTDERYLRLAEDETNSACDSAELIAAMRQGKKYKMWCSMEDFSVRPAHFEADGQKVLISDYFYVNGEHLRFPHDMENGTAINNARCRCHVTFL